MNHVAAPFGDPNGVHRLPGRRRGGGSRFSSWTPPAENLCILSSQPSQSSHYRNYAVSRDDAFENLLVTVTPTVTGTRPYLKDLSSTVTVVTLVTVLCGRFLKGRVSYVRQDIRAVSSWS